MVLINSDYFTLGKDPDFPDMDNRPLVITDASYPIFDENNSWFIGGFIERPFSHGEEFSAGHFLINDFANTHIYNRIWLREIEIDAGFVVEDIDYDMEIWNAKSTDVQCTDIDYYPNAVGLDMTNPAVPFTIQRNYIEEFILTVLQEGAPVQDAIIIFTIDGDEYYTTIEATRVITLPFEPDWFKNVKFEMKFETVIFQTERYYEQRRSLSNRPKRLESFTISESGYLAEKFFYIIQRGKDKIFGVPIFFEVFQLLNATQGQTVLNTNGNIDKFWNLNNLCNFVMLIDIETYNVELKEITAVGVSSVTCKNPLVNTFDINKTWVYSIFLGVIGAVGWKNATTKHDSSNIVFTEI